ncbi:FMN-binding protein [Dactylosporangium salmoneum]|uniref:FMN-binding protein n=1 Tax=Dactylosporangium salmoneum TaxID=53361 RepID=A0ABN3FTM6_9ACTN
MRRIALWLASTVAALVLLFSYRTSTGAFSTATAPPTSGSGATGSGKTYDGSTVQTRWGPVQVRITVDGGKITDVAAVTYPNGNRRDLEINDYALPQLRSEVLQAQSADIDSVSGATVTSEGYKESLQAALDAAHID